MSDSQKINQRVLSWARARMGQQVGSGECWDLADEALRHAGAPSSTSTRKNADYIWGEEIGLRDIQPGDILQFRDFVVKMRTDREITFEDGTVQSSWSEKQAVRGPTHTAIVARVLNGDEIVVLEQHVKPFGKRVQEHTIHQRSRALPPTIRHTRILDEVSGRYRLAKISEKVTVEVSGTIRAYRPKSR